MRHAPAREKRRRGRPRLGQHFLRSPSLAEAIAKAAVPEEGARVVEIGPGRGALTRFLVERAARVVAVELDEELAASLAEAFPDRDRLVIVVADATTADWDALLAAALEGGASSATMAGNLPYGAATEILLRYLERSARDPRLGRAVVMVQLEVAERLAARPGTKAHGSLGVLARSTHEVRILRRVGPDAFSPPPRVVSAVVELVPLAQPLFPPGERKAHAAFVQAAFAQRRKQLAVALGGVRGLSREDWKRALADLGLPQDARAESLTPEQLVALSRASRA